MQKGVCTNEVSMQRVRKENVFTYPDKSHSLRIKHWACLNEW